MVNPVNSFLDEMGLSPKDLDKPGFFGEMETLRKEIDNIEQNPVTIEKLKTYIDKSKNLTIHELSTIDDDKNDRWLSVVCFILPVIGIIRKWYQDQKRMRLEVQLKIYSSLEDLLMAPDRKRKALQEKLMTIKNSNS